ncbi:MAG: hypothetical protein F6K32_11180 [Desertifilum sp. SIO1I2]|nr:hypothetical protein [Desertifilum sp. SIO1I2]
MTIEQNFYSHIRSLGYWDRLEDWTRLHAHETEKGSNPHTTEDPEMMYQLMWLLCSTNRRQRLSAVDARILDRTAEDLVNKGYTLPSTKSYVKYLWEQVYSQEMAQQLTVDEL